MFTVSAWNWLILLAHWGTSFLNYEDYKCVINTCCLCLLQRFLGFYERIGKEELGHTLFFYLFLCKTMNSSVHLPSNQVIYSRRDSAPSIRGLSVDSSWV